MRNKIQLFAALFLFSLLSAQSVTLSRAERVGENKDKFLYLIDSLSKGETYLGEIEVHGFSTQDAEVFSQIYKKAKTIKANGFKLKEREMLGGEPPQINTSHYILELYDLKEKPKYSNLVVLFSSSDKEQKVRINEKIYVMSPRSYIAIQLRPQEVYSLRVGGLLGSKILLSYKENQPVQYFQVLRSGIRADQSGNQGGLTIKSGDIIGLERSYAEFLKTIYKKMEEGE